jgi:SAM-dependent methyltransferase
MPRIKNIGPLMKVPANASRLFETIDESIRQPIGEIQLAASSEHEYIVNLAFNISKIRYDLNYCTSNKFHLEESKVYFKRLLPKLAGFNSFVEIGCGQGEFIECLKGLGFDAVGFDPTLKQSTNYLFSQLWTLSNERDFIPNIDSLNTLYIMRCVLPHIPEPYSFLDSIFEQHPNAGVLIEFQRRDYIEQNKVWPQISHDSVWVFFKLCMGFYCSYKEAQTPRGGGIAEYK